MLCAACLIREVNKRVFSFLLSPRMSVLHHHPIAPKTVQAPVLSGPPEQVSESDQIVHSKIPLENKSGAVPGKLIVPPMFCRSLNCQARRFPDPGDPGEFAFFSSRGLV